MTSAVLITVLYGIIHASLILALATKVTSARATHAPLQGAEHPDGLLEASRLGNNLEYAPLSLVLLLTADRAGVSPGVIHAAGAAFKLAACLTPSGSEPFRTLRAPTTRPERATCN